MHTNNKLRDSHLAKNAQNALQNHLREQEDRKKAVQRQRDTIELRQIESKLYYKKQEFDRVKTQLDRLKREAVSRESQLRHGISETQKEKVIKDLDQKLISIDQSAERKINEINQQIEQKKQELDILEKQKKEISAQQEAQKKSIGSTFSSVRSELLSFQQKKAGEKRLLEITQRQIEGLNKSMKQFSQEIVVLENKVKALKIALR